MNAVDGKLWVESLLEEVGKSAWFAFSKKRERLDSSLEVELGDDKRGWTLSSWNPATRARIVSSRAFWETARWAFAHLKKIKTRICVWKLESHLCSAIKSSSLAPFRVIVSSPSVSSSPWPKLIPKRLGEGPPDSSKAATHEKRSTWKKPFCILAAKLTEIFAFVNIVTRRLIPKTLRRRNSADRSLLSLSLLLNKLL